MEHPPGDCKWCGKRITWDTAQDDYCDSNLSINCGEGTHQLGTPPKKGKGKGWPVRVP